VGKIQQGVRRAVLKKFGREKGAEDVRGESKLRKRTQVHLEKGLKRVFLFQSLLIPLRLTGLVGRIKGNKGKRNTGR